MVLALFGWVLKALFAPFFFPPPVFFSFLSLRVDLSLVLCVSVCPALTPPPSSRVPRLSLPRPAALLTLSDPTEEPRRSQVAREDILSGWRVGMPRALGRLWAIFS